MKKTLIALAAVAATSAAFAQSNVTVSGKFGVAYETEKVTGSDSTRGFAVTDGNVVFSASEDLGGGMKAGASIDVKVRGRQASPSASTVESGTILTTTLRGIGSIDARDASVFLSGGFGEIRMGAVESYNAIIDNGSAGAPTMGLDNIALDGGLGNVDMFRYTGPEFSGFTPYITLMDSIGGPGAGGMQTGSSRANGTQIGLNYSGMGLTAGLEFASIDGNTGNNDAKRFAVSAMYDLGVAAIGAGFQRYKEDTVATANKQYMLGVSIPLDNIVLGATYAKQTNKDNTANYDVKGYELGAQYNLSKRTNIRVAYRNEKEDNVGTETTTKKFQVRLMHGF